LIGANLTLTSFLVSGAVVEQYGAGGVYSSFGYGSYSYNQIPNSGKFNAARILWPSSGSAIVYFGTTHGTSNVLVEVGLAQLQGSPRFYASSVEELTVTEKIPPVENPAGGNTTPIVDNPAGGDTTPIVDNPAGGNTTPIVDNPAGGNTIPIVDNPAGGNTIPIVDNPAGGNGPAAGPGETDQNKDTSNDKKGSENDSDGGGTGAVVGGVLGGVAAVAGAASAAYAYVKNLLPCLNKDDEEEASGEGGNKTTSAVVGSGNKVKNVNKVVHVINNTYYGVAPPTPTPTPPDEDTTEVAP
jgi:hypothetical protein